MRRQRKAFTLAEMLIVIAIIAILAALMLPALSGVREKGRQAKCASNLHQLQLGAMNYVAANGRLPAVTNYNRRELRAPPGSTWLADYYYLVWGWVSWAGWTANESFSPGPAPSPGYSWVGTQGVACIANGSLYPFVSREPGVYLCPTFALRRVCARDEAVRSYSMNGGLSEANIHAANVLPSRTILFGDDGSLITGEVDPAFDPSTEYGRYHNGGGNVVYLDGHVDRLPQR